MVRTITGLLAAGLVLVGPSGAAAATAGDRMLEMMQRFTVGVADGGQVLSSSGGGALASVVKRGVAGAWTNKGLGALGFEDVQIDLDAPPTPAVTAWIAAAAAGSPTVATAAVEDVRPGGVAAGSMVLLQPRLLSVELSALDAAGRSPIKLRLTLRPASITVGPGSPPSPRPRSRGVASNLFRLSLAGLDPAAVMAVDAFTWTFGSGGSASEVSSLRVLISEARSTTWAQWADTFLLQGTSGDSNEKAGRLEFLGADQRPLFALNLGGVGIFRYARAPATNAARFPRREVGLYVESVTLDPAPAQAAQTGATEPSAPAQPDPAPEPASADPTPAETPAPAQPSEVATAASGTEAAPAATPATEPVPDKGSRDIADFPRYKGSVRASFRASKNRQNGNERAEYLAQERPEAVEKQFGQSLRDAGWTETRRDETGDAGAGNWSLDVSYETKGRTARVNYTITKEGATLIWLDVNTDFTALEVPAASEPAPAPK